MQKYNMQWLQHFPIRGFTIQLFFNLEYNLQVLCVQADVMLYT